MSAHFFLVRDHWRVLYVLVQFWFARVAKCTVWQSELWWRCPTSNNNESKDRDRVASITTKQEAKSKTKIFPSARIKIRTLLCTQESRIPYADFNLNPEAVYIWAPWRLFHHYLLQLALSLMFKHLFPQLLQGTQLQWLHPRRLVHQ